MTGGIPSASSAPPCSPRASAAITGIPTGSTCSSVLKKKVAPRGGTKKNPGPWRVYDLSFYDDPKPLRFSFESKQAAELFAKQQKADHPGTDYQVRKANPEESSMRLVRYRDARGRMRDRKFKSSSAAHDFARKTQREGREALVYPPSSPGWWKSQGMQGRKNPGELLIFGNPRRRKGRKSGPRRVQTSAKRRQKRNPDELEAAVSLYHSFIGKDPSRIDELHEPSDMPRALTQLGRCVSLTVVPDGGAKAQRITFDDGRVRLCANAEGSQLWLVGGNQKLEGCERGFPEADWTKDLVDLGDAIEIVYDAEKRMDNFQEIRYTHAFGEESGIFPRAIYDRTNQRVRLAGGNYTVRAPGIID